MFPHSKHAIALPTQCSPYLLVPPPIIVYLVDPEFPSGGGCVSLAPRAPVPKATIYEQRQARAGEIEIRSPCDVLRLSPPSPYPRCTQYRRDRDLGRSVSGRPDLRHERRPLCRRERIRAGFLQAHSSFSMLSFLAASSIIARVSGSANLPLAFIRTAANGFAEWPFARS